MVKQTKTFKKGNVTKKALSAILAASMVMTSSSFVMAAPVEVEDVAVEAAAEVAVGAEETEAVEEAEAADEEQVGVAYDNVAVTLKTGVTYEYTGEPIVPQVEVKSNGEDVPVSAYKIEASNNTNAGTAEYRIEFVGVNTATGTMTYNGQPATSGTFTIDKRKLTAANSTVVYKDAPAGGYVYNGKEQKPEVASATVTFNNKTLTLGTDDYKVVTNCTGHSTDDLKDAGKHSVRLDLGDSRNFETAAGFNLGVKNYEITASRFNSSTISVSAKKLLFKTNGAGYDATGIKTNLTVKTATGETLADDKYDVKLYDQYGNEVTTIKALGTYNIEVKPSNRNNNYQKTASDVVPAQVTIGVAELEDALALVKAENITVENVSGANTLGTTVQTDANGFYVEYNGAELNISDVTIPGLTDDDYEVEKVTGTEAGDVLTCTFKGKGAYDGDTAKLSVQIRPRLITADIVEVDTAYRPSQALENKYQHVNNKTYFKFYATLGKSSFETDSDNAIMKTMQLWVKDKWVDLKEGKDYTYTTDKTSGTIVLTGLGNYTTVNTKTNKTTLALDYDKVSSADLADPSITATVSGTYTYEDGKSVTPDVKNITLVEKNGTQTYTLQAGADKDFIVESYGNTEKNPNNTNAGTGYIVLKGKGKYDNTRRTVTFDIVGKDINSVYKIKPMKNLTVDQAKTANFQAPEIVYINGENLAESAVYNTPKYYRNGKETTDFASTGTITVEVTGKGAYTGKLTASYNITGTDISTVIDSVDKIDDQTYTGAAIEPKVTVNVKTLRPLVTLRRGIDYTVSYKDNVEVGTASAVITGIGKYSGTVVKTFKIVGQMDQTIEVLAAQARDIQNRTLNSKATVVKFEAGKAPKTAVTYTSSDENVVKVDETGKITYTGLGEATITVKAAETAEYKAAEATITVKVGLAKPSFTPFSKNNAFTLTSSTVKGAEKFEVEYATKKDFSNSKTKTFATTSAGKIRQVKVSAGDKKTYYVRVRAISGTTKSAWSATKTVATK